MSAGDVDLTTCDQEPIHLIGAVQPHGTLLAINEATQIIEYASANTEGFFGVETGKLLGRRLSFLLGEENASALPDLAHAPGTPELLKPWFITFKGPDGAPIKAECLPHRSNDHIVLEFVRSEPAPATIWEDEMLRRGIITKLVQPDAMEELANVSATMIRDVTGFDRVMIYKFAEDKHGEVIAEATNRPDSFLGLHYPASDIPDPARRHFTLNVMRSIPDINSVNVPIVGLGGVSADANSEAPLDLTFSKLRAVAPVHVQYLNNMGVGASLSISLITNGALWGLVACHHYEERLISSSRLRFAELLGVTTSTLLQSIENTNQLSISIKAEKLAFRIEQLARAGDALKALLQDQAADLMLLLDAQGMVLSLHGEVETYGKVPEGLDYLRLKARTKDGVAASSNLSSILDMSDAQMDVAAGAVLLGLSEDGKDFLVFLRRNFDQTIRWAGKPEKVETITEDGITRLSPRGSFALWREERRNHSRPFDALDLDASRILRRALFALNSLEREKIAIEAQKSSEGQEARLRHALLDATRANAMGELAAAIAHELNQPLSAVSNYVSACQQEFANANIEVPERAAGYLDEAVVESARAGELVRRIRNFISRGDLKTQYTDFNDAIRRALDLALVANDLPDLEVDLKLDETLPRVLADPVQIGQVVLNLVRNSLVAMEDSDEKLLLVEVYRKGDFVEVSVLDSGKGIEPDIQKYLFDPFYTSTVKGMGFGLSLCRSIVDAHFGKIWVEPLTIGAKFTFRLPLDGRNQ